MITAILGLHAVLYFRLLAAFITAFAIVVIFGKRFIAFLHGWQHEGQPIRENGPQSHLLTKKGTPTMGGLLMVAAIFVATLLWGNPGNLFLWLCLLVLLVYALTGFADDYVKVKKHTPDAMTAKMKLLLQFATALFAVWFISLETPEDLRYLLNFPFINFSLNLSLLYIPFAMVVIAGTSNAVNLSDGLDGLAAGLSFAAFMVFAAIAALTGVSSALDLDGVFIPGSAEVAIVCATVAGACLGFLWFNCSPAQVFMGDTGSLALGALLGTIAVITKHEIVLAIVGIVFVLEALSVMIQVFWYRRTKTRFFLMAPIHHHFEQLGWKETTVVIRFWIVAVLAALVGLSALWL